MHCFNGRHIGVENWLEKFPNCHIGFTAKVSPFNDPQTEARRTIPHYRILLETDSSYMPVSLHHGTNTPAYLGDIARIDAHHRHLSMEDLFALTVASDLTSNPYQIAFWRFGLFNQMLLSHKHYYVNLRC